MVLSDTIVFGICCDNNLVVIGVYMKPYLIQTLRLTLKTTCMEVYIYIYINYLAEVLPCGLLPTSVPFGL